MPKIVMMPVMARKRRGKKIPMPGTTLPANWIVTHTDGGESTAYDAEKKVARMNVDTQSSTNKARFGRRHEMGHAVFSPWAAFACDPKNRPTQIYAAFRNGFEDCRIHELMFRAGVNVQEHDTPEYVAELKAHWAGAQVPDWMVASVFAVGGPHTPLSQAMLRAVTLAAISKTTTGGRWTADKIVTAIERMVYILSRRPEFKLVESFSKACERMWQREEEKKDPDGNEQEEEELRSEEALDEEELRGEEREPDEGTKQNPAYSEFHAKWGKMTVIRKDLLLPFKGKLVQDLRAVQTDNGGKVKWPVRVFTDLRVFEKVKRAPGRAVILIDYSGSMSMSQEDLEDLMLRAPGCLIACYSGDGQRGDLVILADDGKRVGTMPRSHGGNTIDGPSLDWLGAQKAAIRIWISDGQVHGVGGFSVNLLKDCRDKVRAHRIKHVLTIEDGESILGKYFGRSSPQN